MLGICQAISKSLPQLRALAMFPPSQALANNNNNNEKTNKATNISSLNGETFKWILELSSFSPPLRHTCKHIQSSTSGKAVGISWQRPAHALAVGTIEWPQLDLRVTFLDDPCCWHIGDRMTFSSLLLSSLPEAPGSHWGSVVGQNVCPRLVNRWGLISVATRCSS